MTRILEGLPFEIKDVSEQGRVFGYASVFGNVDRGGDRVLAGAFRKTLGSGKRVRMLWQHKMDEVIGGWDTLREDNKGLWVEGNLNLDVQRARETYALMKADQIDGLSIGYTTDRSSVKRASDGAVELSELDLFEVSVVTVPMNPETVASAKSFLEFDELTEKLKAGERLTEREFETLLKGNLGLSNSQAERAARVHLKGPGEPAAAKDARALLEALRA